MIAYLIIWILCIFLGLCLIHIGDGNSGVGEIFMPVGIALLMGAILYAAVAVYRFNPNLDYNKLNKPNISQVETNNTK
jgi:hypothetical protein